MNKAQKLFLQRLLIFLFLFGIVIVYPAEVSARNITRTRSENHAEYRAYLEEKFGYIINIDDSVLGERFYKPPRQHTDLELLVLQDIESTFAMLPDGFVKEVNDYIKSLNGTPTLNIIYQPDNDSRVGFFSSDYDYHSDGNIFVNKAHISIEDGNTFHDVLLHEFAHKLTLTLELKNIIKPIDKFFTDLAKQSGYPYNINYSRLYRIELDHKYFDYYLSEYSSVNFWEDFAETFTYAVMQPRYVSSYGDGAKKPVHDKIEMISKTLTNIFTTLKNEKFLLNCMPDPASRWAQNSVREAKARGIILWGIHGLNTHDITRYDTALILQPFLYKYIDETELLKRAGISRNQVIPQNFVYDIADAEDIYLLDKLGILNLDNGRFNPGAKIQKQTAAIIFTRVASLFGISDIVQADLESGDASKVAEWAVSSVKYAVSTGIMGVDNNNNFNPEEFISYQEFYHSLLNISRLKDELNAQNNIMPPETQYLQNFSQGTTLAPNGWLHYFNCIRLDKFTGKARYISLDGDIYEGEFADGYIHGQGRLLFTDGSYFEGEFNKNKRWSGIYFKDGVYYRIEKGEIISSGE